MPRPRTLIPSLSRPYNRRDGSRSNQYIDDPAAKDGRESYSRVERLRMDAKFSSALERAIVALEKLLRLCASDKVQGAGESKDPCCWFHARTVMPIAGRSDAQAVLQDRPRDCVALRCIARLRPSGLQVAHRAHSNAKRPLIPTDGGQDSN